MSDYSAVYRNLIAAKSKLFLDVLILSEFINSCARLQWKITAPSVADFKQFRDSPAFPPIALAIAADAKRILRDTTPLDHHFTEWKLADLLDDYGTGNFDCNDQLIVEACRKHSLAVLTHDKDFTEGGINVFTTRRELLASCPP